ncbi:MAG TPA: phosphoribosyl-AMP cyclohydrolase [Armatimonadota bacterium]|nr:phosphoribosyl-AMP cyclohydrolase [Armatimonadota bacterium]HOJ22075.1 phosphoribosyl-AMP cyclohydrolase [Armatimonadota bacterium]HOM81132.1 phosphoribosyl-AMP cyclohydrolase [Armatimonadota bacterium]HPO71708.1 phosphoribosyl-AMP cyclohydrolase [Armatimonadota bacterium]HPT97688.1 phosphoribosyl-AMP cyclohydrolase [Armatimonadota bacterium]
MDLFDVVKFDSNGLVTAVVQDDASGEVLMVAYMNREALEQTLKTGRVTFWSRSRREMWVKGLTSGHTQTLKSIAVDCDGDALLVRVDQVGGACHEGYRTCFFRRAGADRQLEITGERLFDPKQVYRK